MATASDLDMPGQLESAVFGFVLSSCAAETLYVNFLFQLYLRNSRFQGRLLTGFASLTQPGLHNTFWVRASRRGQVTTFHDLAFC